MSAENTPRPSERIATAFASLKETAKNLNEATGEFSQPIAQIERALKNLNLGVACWVSAGKGGNANYDFWEREIGYARIRREWGLAIRTTDGHESAPDEADVEEWHFNEAPLYLRLKVVDKLPDLIEALVASADATAKRLREKAAPTKELADAVSAVVAPKKK
jgi:hypothetical protein